LKHVCKRLREENALIRESLEKFISFEDAIKAKEFEFGSITIKELFEQAHKALKDK